PGNESRQRPRPARRPAPRRYRPPRPDEPLLRLRGFAPERRVHRRRGRRGVAADRSATGRAQASVRLRPRPQALPPRHAPVRHPSHQRLAPDRRGAPPPPQPAPARRRVPPARPPPGRRRLRLGPLRRERPVGVVTGGQRTAATTIVTSSTGRAVPRNRVS